MRIFCYVCYKYVDSLWGNGDYCPYCYHVIWNEFDDEDDYPTEEDIQEHAKSLVYDESLAYLSKLFQ